jgi:predicted nucleic acid-binding protein
VSDLIVVDSSVFIDYFRGKGGDTLAVLIVGNRVLLSSVVRLEILSGVRKGEMSIVERVLNALRPVSSFATPAQCEHLLGRARGTGHFGGIIDLMIIADAIRLNAFLLTYDTKMKKLATRLGAKLAEVKPVRLRSN